MLLSMFYFILKHTTLTKTNKCKQRKEEAHLSKRITNVPVRTGKFVFVIQKLNYLIRPQ